ncbi:ASICN [Lepeophtheirus salmonis]|uniref:ASICN n=1 Tax=Lepeophtheirus salmonis TaxID=72036 RepID=A0A7R8H537_LEPSM|nr:ASICN [Lepeophtheirus salmonis]CAF2869673.1 ASICN [Lepeophtheirus salmonis]
MVGSILPEEVWNGVSFWGGMVMSSVLIAFYFIYKQTFEFARATVVTTVDTTTAPLSEVYFPAVTICNINQVRRSFLEELGVSKNWTISDMIFAEFYTGSDEDLKPEEREILKSIFSQKFYVEKEIIYNYVSVYGSVNQTALDNWEEYLDNYREFIEGGNHFGSFAVQEPNGTMILKASYDGKSKDGTSSDFNVYFGTDVGICSIIKPQLSFNSSLDSLPFWQKLFHYRDSISKGSEVGKANGLTVFLDAETFDYTYHLKAGEGFKVSVHHHLDQPIMSIKEIDISVGTESQVAVATTLTTTTDEAKNRFYPEERGCYFEGELYLQYLPKNFYRYEMSNCLFEAAYEEVLKRCNCTPSFHQTGIKEYPKICSGMSLKCMIKILRAIGKYNTVGMDPNNRAPCLAACEDQINLVTETSSTFPNSETFHRREEFCLSQKTICSKGYWHPIYDGNENLMEMSQSTLNKTYNDILKNLIFDYAKKNTALVNVYIKDPVVIRLKRDQKIPVIGFVANTGGLLGLCMGFSLVSAFEILYHLFIYIIYRCKTPKLIKWMSQRREINSVCETGNDELNGVAGSTPNVGGGSSSNRGERTFISEELGSIMLKNPSLMTEENSTIDESNQVVDSFKNDVCTTTNEKVIYSEIY